MNVSGIHFPTGAHGGRITEDFAHSSIDDGRVFRVGSYQTLGAGSTNSILLATPATPEVELELLFDSDGPGVITFSEAPNASGLTVLTPVNANRKSDATASVTAHQDPSIVTTGTNLGTNVVGSEGFKSTAGGSITSRIWILAANTKYLIRFTADGASCRSIIRGLMEEDPA